MKYHTQVLEIDKEDPCADSFLEVQKTDHPFKEDLLDREGYADTLFKFVNNYPHPLTIALDDEWGNGKSTFLRMWKKFLKQRGVPCVYIDAFKYDYCTDPFSAIAGAIVNYEKLNFSRAERLDFLNVYKKLSGFMESDGVPYTLSLATDGVTPVALTRKIINMFKSFFTSEAERSANMDLSRIALIEKFKVTLSSLSARILAKYHGDKEFSIQPLVIIVDELDRCRPAFAIEFLEKIKHFFQTENVIFVLGVNRKELEAAVKCVYGSKNESRFLDKFINISSSLPYNYNRERERPGRPINDFIRDLYFWHDLAIEKMGGGFIYKDETNDMGIEERHISMIQEWARRANLSLRQIQQLFINLAILCTVLEEEHPCFEWLLLTASLKVIDLDLFEKTASNIVTYKDLEAKFKFFEYDITDDQNSDAPKLGVSSGGMMKLAIQFATMNDGSPHGALKKRTKGRLFEIIQYFSQISVINPETCNFDNENNLFSKASKNDRMDVLVTYARTLERFNL